MCIESQFPASASNPHLLSTQHSAPSTQHSTKNGEISQNHRGDSREIRGLTGGRFGGAFLPAHYSQLHQIQPVVEIAAVKKQFFFSLPKNAPICEPQVPEGGVVRQTAKDEISGNVRSEKIAFSPSVPQFSRSLVPDPQLAILSPSKFAGIKGVPMSLVAPHGGKLVNRILEPSAAQAATKEAASLTSITLSPREQ